MQLTDDQTKKLLEYSGAIKLQQLALSMALTRLKGIYKADASPATLTKCCEDLNAILAKFPNIMKSDYTQIINL